MVEYPPVAVVGKEQTFEVKGYTRQEVYEQIREIASKKKIITSKILEENIGYIQMGTLTEENINETMDKMAETDGYRLSFHSSSPGIKEIKKN